jgi:hypothetical protein
MHEKCLIWCGHPQSVSTFWLAALPGDDRGHEKRCESDAGSNGGHVLDAFGERL